MAAFQAEVELRRQNAVSQARVGNRRCRLPRPLFQPVALTRLAAGVASCVSVQPGYVSHEVVAHPPPAGGPQEFTVTQVWDSKAAYEAWFNTPFRRRSHFPPGVWQVCARKSLRGACGGKFTD